MPRHRNEAAEVAGEKMGRIRQLSDEIDSISASAERVLEVSLVVSDTAEAIRLTILARAILNSLPEMREKQHKLLAEQKLACGIATGAIAISNH